MGEVPDGLVAASGVCKTRMRSEEVRGLAQLLDLAFGEGGVGTLAWRGKVKPRTNEENDGALIPLV
jgi:hypothetical protein